MLTNFIVVMQLISTDGDNLSSLEISPSTNDPWSSMSAGVSACESTTKIVIEDK